MDFKINMQELDALRGLPFLPQLLYMRGLRPFMDFATGIIGIKRGVSYQSLSEELYIEPHTGYKSGSPSRAQIRRALLALEKAGLIKSQNHPKKLIFNCCLATQDYCVQNKAVTKPSHQAVTKESHKTNYLSEGYDSKSRKAVIPKMAQAVTPPVSGNNIIFLSEIFEIFWEQYPEKKSKQNAWLEFQNINPDESLFEKIMDGLRQQCLFYNNQIRFRRWVPNWKYPANWLAQSCWEDKVDQKLHGEKIDEISKTSINRKKSASELLWEECGSGFEFGDESINAEKRWSTVNQASIIDFASYRQQC